MLKPRLFEVLASGYSRKTFVSDLFAGIVVGIVAIPLSVAFAIASGVTPDKGLLTAVIAGFLISLLGGSNVQIGGPTGAFIVIIYGILAKYGPDGLILATIMAGVFLTILGYARLGAVIQFIPYPVIVGFTSAIAVSIFSSQVNDFLGLGLATVPAQFLDKWGMFLANLGHTNFWALGMTLVTIVVIIGLNKINKMIPAALIVLVLGTLAVYFFGIPVQTIGSKFGAIAGSIPAPTLPTVTIDRLRELLFPAFSIAMLAGIESLLSAVVADGMTGRKHNSNQELVGQGIANIVSGIFGGLPATGAIARTATNIKSGGQTPVAGIIHAVFLLLVLLFLAPLAGGIPLAVLAGILTTVAYNMSEYRSFKLLLKGPKGDLFVLLATFFLTLLVDLTFAIPMGILFALLFFLRNMSQHSQITVHTGDLQDTPEELDPFGLTKLTIPDGVEVFEVDGPFFFGAAERFKEAMLIVEKAPKVRILRLRHVPSIDSSGIAVLNDLLKDARKHSMHLVFATVTPKVRGTLDKIGFTEQLGAENIVADILAALERSRSLLGIQGNGIADMVRAAQVYRVSGEKDPLSVIRSCVPRMPLQPHVQRHLSQSMIEREEMASTAMGYGVAFPHPRSPVLGSHGQEFVAFAYLDEPIDWAAGDGERVGTAIFIVSSSVQNHLKTLSYFARAIRDPEFRELLKRRADKDELSAWMESTFEQLPHKES